MTALTPSAAYLPTGAPSRPGLFNRLCHAAAWPQLAAAALKWRRFAMHALLVPLFSGLLLCGAPATASTVYLWESPRFAAGTFSPGSAEGSWVVGFDIGSPAPLGTYGYYPAQITRMCFADVCTPTPAVDVVLFDSSGLPSGGLYLALDNFGNIREFGFDALPLNLQFIGLPYALDPRFYVTYQDFGDQYMRIVVPNPYFIVEAEPGSLRLVSTDVPEPGTLALVGLAGVALLWTNRRRTGHSKRP